MKENQKTFIEILDKHYITKKARKLYGEYIDFFIKFYNYLSIEKNSSEHTIRAYLNDLTEFFLFLIKNQISPLQVKTEDIRKYFLEISGIQLNQKKSERNLSIPTQRRKITSIKRFYFYLVKNQYIEKVPVLILMPKFKKKLPENFKYYELNQIFDFFEKSLEKEKDQFKKALLYRDKALIELLYSTGARISEIISLQKDQIVLNSNQDQIQIKEEIKIKGKNKKERFVFIGSYAKKALEDYLKNRNFLLPKSENLFLNSKGEALTDRGVRDRLKFYQNLISISKMYPHKFRHTFATDLLTEGLDIRIIQEFLGHSNLHTTQIYTHLSKAKLKEQYRKSHPLGKEIT